MSKQYKNRNRTSTGTQTNGVSGGSPIPSDGGFVSEEVTEGAGSMRVSITIGHSEDYGRNKFSVSVDHSLSCGQAPEEKERAYNEVKAFCMTKAESLRSEVIQTFFGRADK